MVRRRSGNHGMRGVRGLGRDPTDAKAVVELGTWVSSMFLRTAGGGGGGVGGVILRFNE